VSRAASAGKRPGYFHLQHVSQTGRTLAAIDFLEGVQSELLARATQEQWSELYRMPQDRRFGNSFSSGQFAASN